MKRLAITLATVALLAFPVVALAGSQFYPSSCVDTWFNDASRVTLYENYESDHSNGDDYLIDCFNEDMLDMPHAPSGACQGDGIFDGVPDNWHDCISSIRAYIPTAWKLCLYTGYNWGGTTYGISATWNGQRRDFGPGSGQFHFPKDALRSYRYVLASQPCYTG